MKSSLELTDDECSSIAGVTKCCCWFALSIAKVSIIIIFFAHLFEARATQKCVPETKDTMIMMMLRFGRMKQYND